MLEFFALIVVKSVVEFLEARIAADGVKEADNIFLGLVVRRAVVPA